MSEQPVYVVLYGSLSKASNDAEQESIESQIAAIKTKLKTAYPAGHVIVDAFSDDGFSGSKRNRGPGLQDAIDAAVRTAAEHGECHLWANTSARFGRGSSRPNEARALGELFYEMRRQGVTLRTVHDDDLVTNEMLIGFASKQASKYADDLAESVARSRVRAFNSGEFSGGRPRDGYRIERVHDADGRVVGRKIVFDGERAELWRRIFDLSREGVSDGDIARRLNREGLRTRSGRYFDRRAVADGLGSEFYAGRITRKTGTPEMEVRDGSHPALIPPAEFDALQARRRQQKPEKAPRGRNRPGAGRPSQNHALAGLATCRCGARMASNTSGYTRRDGTRRRYYQCRRQLTGAGCSEPCISAELVDAEIVAALDRLLLDFDAWRERIEARHSDERERLVLEVERAEHDHAAQAHKTNAVERKWSEYLVTDEKKADLVLPILDRERDALAQAERRLTASRDALASVPEQVDGDALLDFANALQEAVRGRLDQANGSMAAVNQALKELFESFGLRETEWAGDDNGQVVFAGGRRAIEIQPVLRETVALALADEWPKLIPTDSPEAPPLRWLTVPPPTPPEENSDLIQPSRSQISR